MIKTEKYHRHTLPLTQRGDHGGTGARRAAYYDAPLVDCGPREHPAQPLVRRRRNGPLRDYSAAWFGIETGGESRRFSGGTPTKKQSDRRCSKQERSRVREFGVPTTLTSASQARYIGSRAVVSAKLSVAPTRAAEEVATSTPLGTRVASRA